MALAKLALRIDGRFLLAAFGLAAAMLVPLAGVLATAGLQPRVEGKSGTVLLADPSDEEGLSGRAVQRATWVLVGMDDASGVHAVAYSKGDPLVGVKQAYDGGPAGRPLEIAGHSLITVAGPKGVIGPGLVLVHPSLLGAARIEAAGFSSGGPASALPARGGDAFEVSGIRELKDYTVALTIVSLPLVVLVASAFARLEARSLSTAVAVVAALGRPERAGQILTGRALLLAACGSLLAVVATVGAIELGLLPVHVRVLAGRGIAFGVAVPAFAAAVAGSAVAWTTVWKARALLRERPSLGGEGRLGWLPIGGRPMVTGWRLAGILLLVGAVVALDVGLPLAAAGVPAALAGGSGEWVLGAQSSSITAGRANVAPSLVMDLDPAIDGIVAEAFVPTVVQGKPFVLRGGDWDAMAHFHGLHLVEGARPGPGDVALGERGRQQTGLHVGDAVLVPGDGGRLGRFMVSGIYRTDSLVADEGILTLADAQRMANLPATTVHALRVHPQTPAALAAMQRSGPDVEVTGLTVDQTSPAGSISAVIASVVNLSGVPGTRVLDLRIDGQAVTTVSTTLQGYQSKDVELPYVVPAGTYDVKVNPETSGFGAASGRVLHAPTGVVSGQPLDVQLLQDGKPAPGIALGLYSNGTSSLLATASTDSQGNATFRVIGTGPRLVAVRDGDPTAAEIYLVAPADAERSRIVVETAYTNPAHPEPGQPATASARVRNVGGLEGSQRVEFAMDGQVRGYKDVHLASGEASTISLDYAPRRSGEAVTVGGTAATNPTAKAAGGPTVSAGPAAPGEALQSQVADRLLGNARAVLGGLALTAAVSALAVLILSARRTLSSRSGIVSVLATVWEPAEIRRRAAVEGAVLGAIGGTAGVLLAKAFIAILASWTTVRAFGHVLGDPYSIVFMVQVAGTMAFLTSLTMYNAVGKRLAGGVGSALRSGEAA